MLHPNSRATGRNSSHSISNSLLWVKPGRRRGITHRAARATVRAGRQGMLNWIPTSRAGPSGTSGSEAGSGVGGSGVGGAGAGCYGCWRLWRWLHWRRSGVAGSGGGGAGVGAPARAGWASVVPASAVAASVALREALRRWRFGGWRLCRWHLCWDSRRLQRRCTRWNSSREARRCLSSRLCCRHHCRRRLIGGRGSPIRLAGGSHRGRLCR